MQNTTCPVHFVIVTTQVFNFQQFGKITIKFSNLQLRRPFTNYLFCGETSVAGTGSIL
jgi:hypothetical protein